MPWLLLCLICLLLPTPAEARVIKNIERWQGEVHVDEELRVDKGGQLLIAPGTRVVSGAQIEVVGRLEAIEVDFSGDDWPGLVLKGTDAQTLVKNCRVTGARTGIAIIGGEPRVLGSLFEKNQVGIEIRQKSRALIENNRFMENSRVGLFAKDETEAIVRQNYFSGQGKFGVYIYRATPVEFRDNQFFDNPTGLIISHYGSDPRIHHNQFERNQTAIKIDRSARPHLSANRIVANQIGIALDRRSDPLVENNLLRQNQQAIVVKFSSYPVIRHNDFSANQQALVLEYQSSRWEMVNGADARQQQIASRGAFGGQKQAQVTETQRKARGLDGYVDARANWWGRQETLKLESLDETANLPWIVDGYDTATFKESGQDWPLDRVRWWPFAPQPFTNGDLL
jgi:parallel beta-helix repeat protein